jgi:hypothetical protein
MADSQGGARTQWRRGGGPAACSVSSAGRPHGVRGRQWWSAWRVRVGPTAESPAATLPHPPRHPLSPDVYARTHTHPWSVHPPTRSPLAALHGGKAYRGVCRRCGVPVGLPSGRPCGQRGCPSRVRPLRLLAPPAWPPVPLVAPAELAAPPAVAGWWDAVRQWCRPRLGPLAPNAVPRAPTRPPHQPSRCRYYFVTTERPVQAGAKDAWELAPDVCMVVTEVCLVLECSHACVRAPTRGRGMPALCRLRP